LDLRQQALADLVAFIKVKRVATNLSTRHLRQVETYAVNEGVEYIILTNGSVWRVYHLTRESLKKRQIDEVWKARRAISPTSLAQVLTSDPVAEAIRWALWRQIADAL
jgi:predicted type IV restriction endonuclease